MNRTILAGLAVLDIATIGLADDQPVKPARGFVANGGWIADRDRALELARKRNRPILAYFTRTMPPCPLCLALESKVLSSKEFRDFAQGYVLYLHDTAKADDGGAALAEAGGERPPHFAWLDRDGTTLFPHEVARTVRAFAAAGNRASRFFSARTAAGSGEPSAVLDYAIERAAVSRLTLPGLERELARLGPPTKSQSKRVAEIRPRLEFERIRRALTGERYLALKRGGFEPEGVDAKTEFFYEILRYGEYVEDADIYECALTRLRKLHGGHDHAADFFEAAGRTLERLRAADEQQER